MQRPRQRTFFTSVANFETNSSTTAENFSMPQVASWKRNMRTVDSDGYLFLITMPWFRIRGRVPGECSRKTLRRNILTTTANFSTPQVANLNAKWELSIPILADFKLTCFDLTWHGACSADFEPHDLFEKSANEKRRRRRLEFVTRSLLRTRDCSHFRPLI